MSRTTRVIKDIETLDQAIKAERDVEAGYHSVIDENLTYWMAVEEDVIDSYSRMISHSTDDEFRKVLGMIVEDSRNHKTILEQAAKMLREIVTDEEKHARLLTKLRDRLEELHRNSNASTSTRKRST